MNASFSMTAKGAFDGKGQGAVGLKATGTARGSTKRDKKEMCLEKCQLPFMEQPSVQGPLMGLCTWS